MTSVKVLLIGDKTTGKSRLIERFITGSHVSDAYFDSVQKGTLPCSKQVEINQTSINIELKTAYIKKPPSLTDNNVVIVCYDVTDYNSYRRAKKFIKFIIDNHPFSTNNIMLVGTMNDNNTRKTVDSNTAKEFTKEHNIPFFETSAKQDLNVNEVFEKAIAIGLLNAEQSQKQAAEEKLRPIKEQLENYVRKIEEEYKGNYRAGFLFFKDSRAENRKANHLLAKELLHQLNKGENPHTLFSKENIETIRNKMPFKHTNRGINSDDLNRAIVMARKAYPEPLPDPQPTSGLNS